MAEVIMAKCNGIMVRVLVDEEDFAEASKIRWYLSETKGKGVRSTIRSEFGEAKTVYLHRLILNAQPGTCVDHINGDVCDNRRANLRIVNTLQNAENRQHANRLMAA